MNKLIRNVVVTASALAPAAVSAHPGQHREELGWSLVHAFTNLDHLLAIAAITLWFAAAVWVASGFKLGRTFFRSR